MTRGGPGGQSQAAGTQGVRDGESQRVDSESKQLFSSRGRTSGKGHGAVVCRVSGLREKGFRFRRGVQNRQVFHPDGNGAPNSGNFTGSLCSSTFGLLKAAKIILESSLCSYISSKPSPWLGVP